jgi:hypothetical protein
LIYIFEKNIFINFFSRDLKTENVFLTKSNVAKIGKLYKCHDFLPSLVSIGQAVLEKNIEMLKFKD